MLAQAGVERAVGFVAGTDNDTTNLSLVAAARRAQPGPVRRGPAEPAGQRAAVRRRWSVDALLVPAEVVAHEVYAQLSTPLLWRFLREMPARGDDWADGADRPAHRPVRQAPAVAVEGPAERRRRRPALRGWLARDAPRLGRPAAQPRRPRRPAARGRRCWSLRGGEAPRAARRLPRWPPTTSCCWSARPPRAGCSTPPCSSTPIREYVLHGRHVPSSWIWRVITGRRA